MIYEVDLKDENELSFEKEKSKNENVSKYKECKFCQCIKIHDTEK